MNEERKNNFRASSFFRWFVNNKMVTAFLVILLLLLNILLLRKVSFIFGPISDFLAIISLPIILAAVFYYLLNPVVDYLEKRKIPRLVTIIVLFLIIAALIVWGLYVAIPSIITGIEQFSHNVPKYVNEVQKQINDILRNERFKQFRPQLDQLSDNAGNTVVSWTKNFSTTAVGSLTGFVGKTAEVLISIIIFPFVLFYLLRDGNNLNGYVTHLLPKVWRKDTSSILSQINSQMGNYVRGQVIVAVSVAIMFCIGLPIIGLKYAIPIAILSGVFNLIPFLGFYLALVPALIVALATGGPFMALKVFIVFMIEQTIEGRLISPLVLGSQLDIHPITILFVILTAGKIWGVWGVILGVPLYAAAKVIITHIYRWYRDISEIYKMEVQELDGEKESE